MSGRSLIYQNGDGDPSSSDKVEVIISPPSSSNPISTQTQQQEPTVPGEIATDTVVNTNVEEEEMRSLREDLVRYACEDSWDQARSILDRYPELVRIPSSDYGSTILHDVVDRCSINFLMHFITYKHVTEEDLEIQDAGGNTAFWLATLSGNIRFLKLMSRKNQNLPLIHGVDGLLPIHLAILRGYHEIVQEFLSENLLHRMTFEDIKRLFFIAIDSNLYDLAKDIILTRGKSLVFARDDEEKTALHIMALKPFVRKNGVDTKDTPHMGFVHMLLLATVTLESSEEKEKLISTLSVLLFDAIKLGNLEFIKTVVRHKLGQSRLKDLATGQTMLHTAVLFRQNSIIDYLLFTGYDKFNLKYGSRTKVVVLEEQVDKNDNNVLHYAARQIQEVSTSLRPDLQMKREVTWFQDMKEKLGSELTEMRNKDGKTPSDMFHVHHRKLSDEVKDTAKTVANSGMVVAALIVAVAFAAALTTPGGNTNAWFIVFIMANAAALFTSALSIVAFWSIFISSTFKESDEFVTSLYPSLIIGKRLLFISLVTMIIAFAAASFLIFGHKYKWAAYVVTLFGLLTIIYILQLQLSLFGRLLDFFSSRNIKRCLKSIKGMFGFEMESGSVSPKEA